MPSQEVERWNKAKAAMENEAKLKGEKEILNKVHEAGIKIIAQDALVNNAPVDKIAGYVIKALAEENLCGKVVVTGQDADVKAMKRILEGTQAMTLLNDSIKLGKITVDLAINLIEGKSINYDYIINNGKVDVPSILIDPVIIDKNNGYSKIKEAGYYKEYFI